MLGQEKYEDRIPDYPYLSARIVKDPSVPFKYSWPAVLWSSLGFTLVELLIVLTIAAILTTIALPSFQDVSKRNRVTADVNKLVRALYLARSEAVKRRVRTVLCRSSNPEASLPICSGTWTAGWILFANTDNDIPPQHDNDEPLIAAHNGLTEGNTLTWNNGNNLQYLPSGLASLNGTFTICDSSKDTYHARGIIISSGRVRRSYDSNNDGVHEDGGGNPLTCP